jgi:hypothetical protein
MAKKFPLLKIHEAGPNHLYEISSGPQPELFVAVLNKSTVVASPVRSQITDAFEKAAGKRETQIQNKAMQKLLTTVDPKQSAQVAAVGEMIMGRSYVAQPGAKPEYRTLGDENIDAAQGSLMADEELKGKVTLTAKNADAAGNLAKEMNTGLAQTREMVRQMAAGMPDFAPFAEILQSITIEHKDQTITVEGQGSPRVFQLLLKEILGEAHK